MASGALALQSGGNRWRNSVDSGRTQGRIGTILAFLARVLEHTLSEEEHSQILQTIDMFEVITRTQPDDYQSLEILKEAYTKVGRKDEAMRMSRKLAEAYFASGSYALAMQECEAMLVHDPNAPEILAMLGEIETRLQAAGQTMNAAKAGPENALTASIYDGEKQGGLVRMEKKEERYNLHERGDDHLAKFLIMQQFFPEEEIAAALETIQQLNKSLGARSMAASLLDKLCRADDVKTDTVLSGLIDRTKSAFIPLEYYDLDRQLARLLPDSLTIHRLFVPFELISRTIMVACANPFDSAGRSAVQQSLDYTVSWFVARPRAIIKALQDSYRIENIL